MVMSDPSIPSVIAFADLELRPFRYAERRDEDGLAINFQATLTDEQTATLRRLPRGRGSNYFPVEVAGREPLQMRLGGVWWQSRDAGVDHDITLVSDEYDAHAKPTPLMLGGEPHVGHLMRMVAALRREMDALLDAAATGSLSAETVASIREAGKAAWPADEYAFKEVDDLSAYWLGDEDGSGDS
jgi:hypothetical protein